MANETAPCRAPLQRFLARPPRPPPFLTEVHEADGDRDRVVAWLQRVLYQRSKKKYASETEKFDAQRTRAVQAFSALQNYLLVDRETHRLTPVGEEILGQQDDTDFWETFATHILTKLNGSKVIEAVRSLHRGMSASSRTLLRELSSMGFLSQKGRPVSETSTDHLHMLDWLERAGVLAGQDRQINEPTFLRLARLPVQSLQSITSLTNPQRAFLRHAEKAVGVERHVARPHADGEEPVHPGVRPNLQAGEHEGAGDCPPGQSRMADPHRRRGKLRDGRGHAAAD